MKEYKERRKKKKILFHFLLLFAVGASIDHASYFSAFPSIHHLMVSCHAATASSE